MPEANLHLQSVRRQLPEAVREQDAGESPLPPAATTIASGGAGELRPARAVSLPGSVLRLSHVTIADHVTYSQFSERHLLHAVLSASVASSQGWVDGQAYDQASGRRGSISVTPASRERRGSIGKGEILGLEIGFDDRFFEDACEQALRPDWHAAFDAVDDKAFAASRSIATLMLRNADDRTALDLALLALARHLGHRYAGADRRRDDGWLHPAALGRIVERLRENPAQSVPLSDMAREAGLGVSAFVRAFRGSVGETPAAFARKVRVDHASQILRSTDLSVNEVATLSGFASGSHLVRTFRKHRGATPAQWRREGHARSVEA